MVVSSTTILLRRHIVIHMDPSVGGILGTLQNFHRLMHHAGILLHRVGIQDRGPEQSATSFRLNGEIQLREIGATTALHIRQI